MRYTGVSLLYANGIGVQVLQEVQKGYERYGELYEDVQRVQEVSFAYLLLMGTKGVHKGGTQGECSRTCTCTPCVPRYNRTMRGVHLGLSGTSISTRGMGLGL